MYMVLGEFIFIEPEVRILLIYFLSECAYCLFETSVSLKYDIRMKKYGMERSKVGRLNEAFLILKSVFLGLTCTLICTHYCNIWK